MSKQTFSLFNFIRNIFKKEKVANTFTTQQFEEDIDWEAVPNQ